MIRYAYSNNGFSFRVIEDGDESESEVTFAAEPSEADLREAFPARAEAVIAALLAGKLQGLEAFAEAKRVAVAGTDSGTKMAVYREKYDVALAALGGDSASLALLAPEAAARGETASELAGLVKTLGDAWRAAGLALDATYQIHKAALAALHAGADEAGLSAYDFTAAWPL